MGGCVWANAIGEQGAKRTGNSSARFPLPMPVTPKELLGAAAFPLILLAGVVALASILYSRAGRMEPDDWIAAMLVRTRIAALPSCCAASMLRHADAESLCKPGAHLSRGRRWLEG